MAISQAMVSCTKSCCKSRMKRSEHVSCFSSYPVLQRKERCLVSILIPELLEEKVLGKNDFGKALLERTYKHPKTGKPYGYGIFDYKGGTVRPSIFLPLTANRNVIAIRQFREGAGEEILELPGGNPKKGQTAEDV